MSDRGVQQQGEADPLQGFPPRSPSRVGRGHDGNTPMGRRLSGQTSPRPKARVVRSVSDTDQLPLHPHALSPHRVLGVGSVVALTWFNVSGGAFGSEEVISAGGPGVGFLAILIMTLFLSIPVACMTAELSAAFPDDGGYSIWVQQAFGDFWGYQESYWSWISGVTDNSVYPVLVYDSCVRYVWRTEVPPVTAYFLKLGLVVVFTLPNIFSVKVAGRGLVGMMVIVLIPFLLLTLVALPKVDPAHWAETRPVADIDWHVLITTTFWNLCGFDAGSTFAGEVVTPEVTYPRAMIAMILAILGTYFLPLAAAVGVNSPDWSEWRDGSFTTIADAIAGKWLGYLLVVCSMLSNAGLFIAELFEDSFQLLGMAQAGMLPPFFARRSRFNTPVRAIMLSVVLIALLVSFDFTSLLVIQNFLYCLGLLLELLACVKLRYRRPDLKRPDSWVVLPVWAFVFPTLVTFGMLYISLSAGLKTTVINMVGAVVGVVLYYVQQRWWMPNVIQGDDDDGNDQEPSPERGGRRERDDDGQDDDDEDGVR